MPRLLSVVCLLFAATAAYGQKTLVALSVREPAGVARLNEPLTTGVPFARGVLPAGRRLGLVHSSGALVPVQTRELARWPDGSVKWALLDFQVGRLPAGGKTTYRLVADPPKTDPRRGIAVSETKGGITVDTGAMQVTLSRTGFDLVRSVKVDRNEVFALKPRPALEITDLAGTVRDSVKDLAKGFEVKVMERGPLRTVVRAVGEMQATEKERLGFTCWYFFCAGRKDVRVFFTMRNLSGKTITHTDQRSTQDANFQKWLSELPGNVTVKAVDLVVPTAKRGGASAVIGGWTKPHQLSDGTLYQDSSASWPWQAGDKAIFDPRLKANAKWMAKNAPADKKDVAYWEFNDGHYTSLREKAKFIGCTFRGYKVYDPAGKEVAHGERAPGWVQVGKTVLGVRWFWQLCPKSIAVGHDGTVRLGLWPKEWAERSRNHTFAGHIHKTHEILLAFDQPWDASTAEASFKRFSHRLLALAPKEYYGATLAFNGPLMPEYRKGKPYVKWEDWALTAVQCGLNKNVNPSKDSSMEIEREKYDHYGIWHFGDSAKRAWRGFGQYLELDVPYCLAAHFARTGNRAFFDELEIHTRQLMDVPAHGGGYGHQKGESSHYYTSGALLYYYLTGLQHIRQSIKVSHDAFARPAPWHLRSFAITMWSNLDMYRAFGDDETTLDQPWNYPAGPWKRSDYLNNIRKDLEWLDVRQNKITGGCRGKMFMIGLSMDALAQYCCEFPDDADWRDRMVAYAAEAMHAFTPKQHTLTSPNGYGHAYRFTGQNKFLDFGVRVMDGHMPLDQPTWPHFRVGTASSKGWSEFGHRLTHKLWWARWWRDTHGTPAPPAAITDLKATKKGNTLELTWTAPDFGKGSKPHYVIKVAGLPLSDEVRTPEEGKAAANWWMTPRVKDELPAPAAAGTKQSGTMRLPKSAGTVWVPRRRGFRVQPSAAYYVAIRCVKQVGPITSVGDISNVVKVDK